MAVNDKCPVCVESGVTCLACVIIVAFAFRDCLCIAGEKPSGSVFAVPFLYIERTDWARIC
jgi:hypothetical protein